MSDIFQISNSGIRAASRATEVVASNIANVNTPGYSRQSAVLSTWSTGRTGGAHSGIGAQFSDVKRIRDGIIDQQIQSKQSQHGSLLQKMRVYQTMEQMLITGDGKGLDMLMTDFFTSFSGLAANPGDPGSRQAVLAKAENLTGYVQSLDGKLQDLSNQMVDSMRRQTLDLNASLKTLESLNASLKTSAAGTMAHNGLLDKQTAALRELSKLVDVDVHQVGNHQVEVRIAGLLVLSSDGAIPIRSEIDTASDSMILRMDNGRVLNPRSGEMAATMSAFMTDIPTVAKQLDQLTGSLVESVNEIHRNGFGLVDGESRDFFWVGGDGSGRTAGTITISSAIKQQPMHLAASSVAGEPANSKNAVSLSMLLNQPNRNGRSLIDQAIEWIAEPGLRLNQLDVQKGVVESSMEMLVRQQQDLAGVNMDEELSLLIKYQNAYQASAKVMTVARDMHKELMNLI